jgi:hypothetical protein
MAIRIPILTSFDPKGLKQANASFATLQNSVGSLSRNFAVAGVAIGAAGAFLGKAVNSASNLSESVNAVNVAFGSSAKSILALGENAATSLGLSKTEFNEAAVAFSSFAERIVGKGGDTTKFIQELTTRAADFASVYNLKGGVAEALERFRSGLAGQTEPLAKFGVNLLDTEVKAYAVENGIAAVGKELTATEKVQARFGLLMQETAKTAGDFANTSDGLANGMRRLQSQVADTQAEIGTQLLPVLEGIMPTVRELATEFGQKLSDAVKAVDWKSVITAVANFTTTIVTNIEQITKTIGVLFLLNTAYKTLTVVIGFTKVAVDLYKWSLAQATAGTKLATIATTIFSTALKLIPIVAIISGLALLVAAFTNTEKWAGKSASGVATFAGKLEYAGGKAAVLKTQLDNIPKEITTTYTLIRQTAGQVASSFGGGAFDAKKAEFDANQILKDSTPTPTSGGSSASKTFEQTITFGIKKATAQGTLQGFNFAQGYIDGMLSTKGGLRQANELITKVTKASAEKREKIVNKANTRFAGTIGEVNRVAAENAARDASAAAQAASDLIAAQQAAQAAEAAALAERERVYNSFLESVKNTFAGIKNAILGAFDLPQLGGSTNAITRNMDKLLVRLRAFAANVSKLSGMGLNPALLQQVISAGPMAGARLAESLVMGGAGALSAINAGYSEFGALSSQIAETGTNALFNREAQQTVYNINVDGGVGSGSTIGKAIVDAIKAYERTSGAVWQGA